MLYIPGEELPKNKYLQCNSITSVNKDMVFATQSAGYTLHDDDAVKESIPVSVIDSANIYYPEINDIVIGTIIDKTFDYYSVDVKGTDFFILNALEFEGATRKNKPDLEIGQLIYARVLCINEYERSELSCISPYHKKSWSTGEAFFQPLVDGFLIDVSKLRCNR